MDSAVSEPPPAVLFFNQWKSKIDQTLESLVPDSGRPYGVLFQAARYALLGPGKRLRPLLTLATVDSLGKSPEMALIPACALELVHTYSLVHDDLPCMDDDDFRRGKPTLHRAFPEGQALLAGDYLLTFAFELLAYCPLLSAECKVELIQVLSHAAGGEGMIAGQVMDLLAEMKVVDLDTLTLIHQKKTGALFAGAIEFGAILAHVSLEQRMLLKTCGEKIGLAFQIMDDILDHVASERKHGRSVSSDQINKKSTYVALLGLEPSRVLAQQLYQSALELFYTLPKRPDSLIYLTEKVFLTEPFMTC